MKPYTSRRGPKKLRVFEAFSGIGAQKAALEKLHRVFGLNYEIVGTSDWFINAIIAYDAIHCYNLPSPRLPSKEEQLNYLRKFQFSVESVRPLKKIEILPDDIRERLYLANIRTRNMGSITDIQGGKFPDCDLLIYSFPCQDLSTGGKGAGMAKGSNTRSGLIWQIERILQILHKVMAEGSEDFEISLERFNFEPIPCIKANVDTEQYDAYLAVIPGAFLAAIYKEYGARLLKANVRAFLNMTGQVNRGIRDSIRTTPEKFFAYNNGISTTAKSVDFISRGDALYISSFTGLQIINGGQTTASLALASIKDKTPLDKVFVQMKLTIVKTAEKEFIRNIARFANSQTKVTQTDLNSSHEYYIQLETLSRRIFAPVHQGDVRPTKWFFERTKKQYNQPLMTKTKAEQNSYKALYPSKQKITIEDTAKYINLSLLRPFDVAWGAQENAKRFHKLIEKEWDESSAFCDDLYFERLVGMAIFYKKIREIISKSSWYLQKTGNLAQMVAYTFSKLVYEANRSERSIDFLVFWKHQQIPSAFWGDIESVAKKVFDMFYDPSAQRTDVREYCKKPECWEECMKIPVALSLPSDDSVAEKSM